MQANAACQTSAPTHQVTRGGESRERAEPPVKAAGGRRGSQRACMEMEQVAGEATASQALDPAPGVVLITGGTGRPGILVAHVEPARVRMKPLASPPSAKIP